MSSNTMKTTAEERLRDLGVDLPRSPTPLGAYTEVVQTGNLLFLSGTLPLEDGSPKFLRRTSRDSPCGIERSCSRQGVSGLVG
jgi:enamine deaminase RidA (YjgF/YER057c/UK114 family)